MKESNSIDSIETRWQKAIDCYRSLDKSGALFLFKSLAKYGVWKLHNM